MVVGALGTESLVVVRVVVIRLVHYSASVSSGFARVVEVELEGVTDPTFFAVGIGLVLVLFFAVGGLAIGIASSSRSSSPVS